MRNADDELWEDNDNDIDVDDNNNIVMFGIVYTISHIDFYWFLKIGMQEQQHSSNRTRRSYHTYAFGIYAYIKCIYAKRDYDAAIEFIISNSSDQ